MPSLVKMHVSLHGPQQSPCHVIPNMPHSILEDCNAKATIRMTTISNGVRKTRLDDSSELAHLVSKLRSDETLQEYARKVEIARSHVTFKIDRHEQIRRCVEKLSEASSKRQFAAEENILNGDRKRSHTHLVPFLALASLISGALLPTSSSWLTG